MLDGGLATELEARGCDLNDELWSAKVLLDQPDLIRGVHRDYLIAGADCIASATYQATIDGFERRGLSRGEAAGTIEFAVRLAVQARDEFWSHPPNRSERLKPLVAASVGPYGAYLADGSEYVGRYDIGRDALASFHRERWRILVESGADLLACETIPSHVEALALLDLLGETPRACAWFTFSCRDGERLSDGSMLRDAIAPLAGVEQVLAVGVNCTAPRFVPSLIAQARSATDKPLAVYPNSGEQYDAVRKRWIGLAEPVDFGEAAREWHRQGARLIGGCCRTGPAHVKAVREALRCMPRRE